MIFFSSHLFEWALSDALKHLDYDSPQDIRQTSDEIHTGENIMTIRNILTSAAIAAVLGFSGGSVFAEDTDSHAPEGFLAVASANYPGPVVEYNDDASIGEDEARAITNFEEANVPDNATEVN
jgi:hypothetical protein